MFQTTNQWYMLPLVDVTFPTFMWFCNAKKGVDPSPNPLNICPKTTSILLEPEPEGRDCCYEKILHVFWLPIEICWSNPTLRKTVRAPKKTVAQTWIWPFKGKKVPDSQNPILYIYICIHTYIYTHTYTDIYTYTDTYIYICTCTCTPLPSQALHLHLLKANCYQQNSNRCWCVNPQLVSKDEDLKIEFHMFWLQTGFVLLEIPIFTAWKLEFPITWLWIKTLVAFRENIKEKLVFVNPWVIYGLYMGYIWVIYGLYNPYNPKVCGCL